MKFAYQKETCIPTFIATLFIIANMQARCLLMDAWIKKM
jgi:hypothetical protein